MHAQYLFTGTSLQTQENKRPSAALLLIAISAEVHILGNSVSQ
jgi:hypothetical protein